MTVTPAELGRNNPNRDYRDIVIEQFADDVVAREAQILDLEADNRILRETLHEALSMLHRQNVRVDRYESRIRALIVEVRDTRDELRIVSAQLRATHEQIAA